MRLHFHQLGCLLFASGLMAPAVAQAPLSPAQALERAERAGYANRAAAGQSEAQAGQALAPMRGILPSVRLESSYLRTTDPLNAFGFTLRQRAVTPAAFAPARLNDPRATGDQATGLVIEQPLFNADAWLGRRAAVHARDATRAAEQWTRQSTALQVYQAYWGTVLAAVQTGTLRAAAEAGRSHLRQAEALVHQGMATRSDALLAAVKSGEVEADLLRAGSDLILARRSLALLMGDPSDSTFMLPDSLPPAAWVRLTATRAGPDSGLPTDRADLRAADRAEAAARADVSRAKALLVPRVNGFGRLDWNTVDTPFGGKSAWTVGVVFAWSPFSGGSELAEIRTTRGRSASATATADAARAQASLERARAREELSVALARMEIAERGVTQAREAHRIVARKYDGGLATVTELFDAAAIETVSDLGFAAARYDAMMATAASRHAQGLDLSVLLDLEN